MKYLLVIAFLLFVFALVLIRQKFANSLGVSNLASDEEIVFFPTYGSFDPEDDQWRFDVQGKVFEPEVNSAKRSALIATLRASVGAAISAEDSDFRDDRIMPFLVDNERGKAVVVEVQGKRFEAGVTGANGRFSRSLTLPATPPGVEPKQNQIQPIDAILSTDDSRSFSGLVHLIAPKGVSVISDIDDTIKHSDVTNKSELLRNTFVRDFRAVEGMPDLYASLSDAGVAFHYVSGSPWQLLGPIESFIDDAGFPKGTMHLKQFRLKDSSALELLGSQVGTKLAAVEPLLLAFPGRSFILIGDSGEQDPEIYGQIARKYPDQVAAIFIRNATGEEAGDHRFVEAFRDLADDKWGLFDDVSQIEEQAKRLANAPR